MSETPDAPAIRLEIERLQKEPAYHDVMSPSHDAAVAAMQVQFEKLYPKDGAPPMSAPWPDESAVPLGNQIEYHLQTEVDRAALDAYGPADQNSLENALHNSGGGGDPASIDLAVGWLRAIEAPAALASTVATQAAQVSELPTDEQVNAAGREAEQTLREEWGAAYEAKLALANGLVARLPADARTFLDASGLCNNVAIIRMVSGVAEAQQRRAKS